MQKKDWWRTGKRRKGTYITLEHFEITDLFECIETEYISGNRKCDEFCKIKIGEDVVN